jgi:Ca-activated chloride channel homolog
MLLTNSEFKQSSSFENVLSLARDSMGDDHEGYRKEFVKLVRVAQGLNDTSKK